MCLGGVICEPGSYTSRLRGAVWQDAAAWTFRLPCKAHMTTNRDAGRLAPAPSVSASLPASL